MYCREIMCTVICKGKSLLKFFSPSRLGGILFRFPLVNRFPQALIFIVLVNDRLVKMWITRHFYLLALFFLCRYWFYNSGWDGGAAIRSQLNLQFQDAALCSFPGDRFAILPKGHIGYSNQKKFAFKL